MSENIRYKKRPLECSDRLTECLTLSELAVQTVRFKCRQSDGVSDITRKRDNQAECPTLPEICTSNKILNCSDRLTECLTLSELAVQTVGFKCRQSDGVSDITRKRYNQAEFPTLPEICTSNKILNLKMLPIFILGLAYLIVWRIA